MVAETRARWLDIGAKSQFTEPPPESRAMVDEMLGRTSVISTSETLAEMTEMGLMEWDEIL